MSKKGEIRTWFALMWKSGATVGYEECGSSGWALVAFRDKKMKGGVYRTASH